MRNLGSPRPSLLPNKRPKRILRPEERGLRLDQQPAAIATVLADLKAGNLEHARKVAATFIEDIDGVKPAQMSPGLLKAVCLRIKATLEEAGIR